MAKWKGYEKLDWINTKSHRDLDRRLAKRAKTTTTAMPQAMPITMPKKNDIFCGKWRDPIEYKSWKQKVDGSFREDVVVEEE